MIYFNPKICRGHNLSFFGLGPWAIIHGIAKFANIFIVQIRILMMLFERCVSKLSENNIIVQIGFTEFKLWQLKRIIKLRGGGELQLISTAINFTTVDRISKHL